MLTVRDRWSGTHSMLGGFAWLPLFLLAGEVVVRSSRLPLPAPVVGMLLLLPALAIRGGVPDNVRAVGDSLLSHLMLLLVPATTALMRRPWTVATALLLPLIQRLAAPGLRHLPRSQRSRIP